MTVLVHIAALVALCAAAWMLWAAIGTARAVTRRVRIRLRRRKGAFR